MSDKEKPEGLDAAEAHVATTYTTRDPFEILDTDLPEPPEIWGGLSLARGQLMEVIGSSGLGKSRLMLNLAINQILGRDFAGMPTYQTPLTWLFFGNENSFFRYRKDLRAMTSILKTEEKEKLRGRIWLPTMETPNDAYLSFSDEENREKFKATIRLRKPDVLVLDPWGAIIDGDELSDQDVRRTLSNLLKDVTEVSQDKPLPVIIMNHSRMGARDIVNASGIEAANFGKNSKAIFTVMRNVWNLRRGSDEGAENPIIELIHAKCSDHPLYPKSAVELMSGSLTYRHLPNFDHEMWQAKLVEDAKKPSPSSEEGKRALNQIKQEDAKQKVLAIFKESENFLTKDDFITAAARLEISEKVANAAKTKLIAEGEIKTLIPKQQGASYYFGPTDRIIHFYMQHKDEFTLK